MKPPTLTHAYPQPGHPAWPNMPCCNQPIGMRQSSQGLTHSDERVTCGKGEQ